LIIYQVPRKIGFKISVCWMVLCTKLCTSFFYLTSNNVRCIKYVMRSWTPERIKTLRKQFKLSQTALGKLTGVAGNYIYMLEGGDRTPSKTLCLLLDRIEAELQGQNKKEGEQ